jgi:hypothetical protein
MDGPVQYVSLENDYRVFNILVSFFDLIGRYIIWLYLVCFVVILYNLRNYVIARRARVNTIFSVEREVSAHREGRSMANIGVMLGIIAVVLGVQHYVLPSVDVLEALGPTPTITLPIPTPTVATPTPELVETLEPTATPPPPTATPRPTSTPDPNPTATPPPPAAACADPNTCITSPGSGARLSGVVTIRGTARHGNFQFYKIEQGAGEDPQGWHSIGDTVSSQVSDGVLMQFDSRALPNGVYWLRLTVVDITGNFPTPHRVRVVIEN